MKISEKNQIKNWITEKLKSKIVDINENNSTVKINCSSGHFFKKTWKKLQKGEFCPYCSSGIGERVCRSAFEKIFNTAFKKIRPKTLRGRLGRPLELDGYAEFWWNGQFLKIAFEHQGRQHYEISSFFNKNKKIFLEAQERDKIKKIWAEKNKVILIEVPEIFRITHINDLLNLIKMRLKEKNIEIVINFKINEILTLAWTTPEAETKLAKMKITAKENGLKLLTNNYIGAYYDFNVKCKCGNIFKTCYNRFVNKKTYSKSCKKCSMFLASFYAPSGGIYKYNYKNSKHNYRTQLSIGDKKKCKIISLGVFKTKEETFVAHKIATIAFHKHKIEDKEILQRLAKKASKHPNLWIKIFKKNVKMKELMFKHKLI